MDTEECHTFGGLAGTIAQQRDMGVSLSDTQEQLMRVMAAVEGQDGYIVQDDADVAAILGLAAHIYAVPEDPDTTAKDVEADCLRQRAN